MPRFFFDLYDGEQFAPDALGVDLPDVHLARKEAIQTLSEIASQEIPDDGPSRVFRIVVLDENRTPVSEARIDFKATHSDPMGSSEGGNGDDNGG